MEVCVTDSDGETFVFKDENGTVNFFKHLDCKREAERMNCNSRRNYFKDTNHIAPVYLSSPWEGSDARTTGLVNPDAADLHSVAVYDRNRTRDGTSLLNVCERYGKRVNEGMDACFTIHDYCECLRDQQSRHQVQNCQHGCKTKRVFQSSLTKWHECRYYRMKINRNSIITTPNGFSDFIRVNQNKLHCCWQKEIVATKKHCEKGDLQSMIKDLTESTASNGINDIISEALESSREDANLIDKVVEVHNQISKGQLCVATPPKDYTEPRIRVVVPRCNSGETRNMNDESSLIGVRNHVLKASTGTPPDVRKIDTSVMLQKTERHRHQHKKNSTKDLRDIEVNQSSCSEDKDYMTEAEDSQQKKEKRMIKSEKYKRLYENRRKLYSPQTERESEDKSERKPKRNGYRRMKRPIKHKDKHRDKNDYISWNIKQQNKKQEGQTDTSSGKIGMITKTQGRKGDWKCNHKSFHLIKEMSCKVGSFAEELFKTICKKHKKKSIKSEMRRNVLQQATKEGKVEDYEAEPESSPDFEVTILERANVSENPMDRVGRIACVEVSKLTYQPLECRDKPVNNAISDENHRKRSDEERRGDQAVGKEDCRKENEEEKSKGDNAISETEYRTGNQDEKMTGDTVEEEEELRARVSQPMHKEGNEGEKGEGDTATSEEKNREGNESEERQDDYTVNEEECRKGSEGEERRGDNTMSVEESRKDEGEKRKLVPIEEKIEAFRESEFQPVHKKVKIKTEPITLEETQDTSCADQITSMLLDYEEGQCVVQTQNVQSDFGSTVAVKTEKVPSNLEDMLSIVKTEPDFFRENNMESTEITMYKEQLKMEDLSIVVKPETLEEEAYPASMEDIRNFLNTLGMPAMKMEY
ncbi:titin homolog [Penaeus indicus]|uniref:titin homolog n=1 Tax=Penaeus indicus TaxID=29960 RepID=UPI00300C4E7C